MAARIYRNDRDMGRLIGMSALAGAVGALVRGLYYMICGAAVGVGPWAVPNLAGSMLTGTRTSVFAAGTSLGGLLLHLVTGAIWGVIFGLVVGYLMPRALATRGRTLVTLAPGATANALLRITHAENYPAAQCHPTAAQYLQVYPPGQTTPMYVAYSTTACAGSVGILSVSAVQSGAGSAS